MFRALLLTFFIYTFSAYGGSISAAQDSINHVDEKGRKQGRWVKKENGNKRYEGQFKDDKPSGRFTYYHPNGKTKAITDYSNNGSIARTQLFDPEGTLEASGKYIDRIKDSTWTFYFKGGKKISSIEEWKNGKKNGMMKTFFLDGKPATECNYLNDEPDGLCREYFTTGTLKKEYSFKNGMLEGPFKTYFMNQLPEIIGNYEKALKVGDWIEYNQDGKIRYRRTYSAGILKKEIKMNGTFKDTYLNGIPSLEISYKDGKKDGPFREYYDAGNWKRVQKQNDEGESEFVEVLEGTKIQREGAYQNDKLHGKIITYDENGKVIKTEEYKEGVPVK